MALRLGAILLAWVASVIQIHDPPTTQPGPLSPHISPPTVPSGHPSAAIEFKVEYYETDSAEFRTYRRFLSEWAGIDSVAAQLTGSLRLPQTVLIAFGECGEANAFYERNRNRVVMCYELFDVFLRLFSEMSTTDEEAVSSATGATLWVLLHETGHALADLLELPLTGREEDAVDQFALYVLLQMKGGPDAAVKGSLALLGLSEAAQRQGTAGFWDEHSFAEQRFANVMCWLYGSDPGAYSNLADALVREAGASQRRLARCADEHDQLVRSWSILLRPHLVRTRGAESHTLPPLPTQLAPAS